MGWQLKSALTGAMLIASVGMAHAVQVTFNFTGVTSYESPFSITAGGVTVDVSGHSVNGARTNVRNENVTRHSLYGIGITSHWGDDLPVDSPDYYGDYSEFIQFVFSENVSITSATFTYVDSNDDFRWLTDIDNSGVIDTADFASLSLRLDLGNSSPSTYNAFGPGAQDIRVLGIGAFDRRDEWKLRTLVVDFTSPVPVPAALPLFGTGLALMGFVGWRRRRKAAAA